MLAGTVEVGVGVAVAGEAVAQQLEGEFRRVAIRAEMTENHMAEVGMRDLAEQVDDLGIGQMAVSRTDPLFDWPRAFEVGIEQVFVVVGFDKQGTQAAKFAGDGTGDVADIREQPKRLFLVPDDETDGIHCVVLGSKGVDSGMADTERLAGLEGDPVAALDAGFAHDLGCGGSGEDRSWVIFEENLQAADVIAVFVGEQNAVEGFWRDADLGKAQRELLGAQASIDHEPHAAAIDDCRIATAATSKHREPHGADREAAPRCRQGEPQVS